MAADPGRPSKDNWDKLSVLSGLLASILVPIAVTAVGSWYTNSISDRDQKIRQATFDREWVQLGLDILRDPNTAPNVREWGVQIITKYAQVPMQENARQALISGAVLPESTTVPTAAQQGEMVTDSTTTRMRALAELQSEGIKALLDKDIQRAIAAYDKAYLLWPTFRNVDEIRRAFIAAQTTAATRPQGIDWQQIYKSVAKMDLRGLDQETHDLLLQAAGGG